MSAKAREIPTYDMPQFVAAIAQKAGDRPLSAIAKEIGIARFHLQMLCDEQWNYSFFAACEWLGMAPDIFVLPDVIVARFDVVAFIGEIERIRQYRGTSRNEFLQRTGIDYSQVVRIKAKNKGMNVQTLATLCAWAGISADDFIKKGETIE